MEENYLGVVKIVGRTFAGRGWVPCDGRTLPVTGNEALFSLLNTRYGGEGEVTFKLPDLRDPQNPAQYRGFGPEQPLMYVICVEGLYPARP